ncbi:AsnC family transcriptional regulator [Aestuariivirga sp.]|uniref:Lrp/AsnC family transcriptional regulator n=1 Tax=Aestuariivirga sp. TaxID=2650926 RepID=UPI0030167209
MPTPRRAHHRGEHVDRLRPVGRHRVTLASMIPLDPTDRQLIEALQKDGRASYADLAALVSLSPAATRLRVQRLLDAGVVQVVGVTDPLALGYPVMAALGVRVERNVRDVADKIAAAKAACVFREPQYDDRVVQTVIEGTGAREGVLDPLGAGLEPGAPAYPRLLRNLAKALKDCLSGS